MTEYVNLKKLPESRRPDWQPWEALAKARDYAKGDTRCDHGHGFEGYCAHLAFCVYGMVSSGYYDAASMWRNTPSAFKRYDHNPPAGALPCYGGGSHGHVAIADTFGGIFTNDIRNGRYSAGAYGRASLMAPVSAFGQTYLGYILPYAISSEDGRTPPKTKPHGQPHHDKPPKTLDVVDGWFEVTARGGLNVREHPSANAKVVKTFDRGHATFIEKAARNDGRTWYRNQGGLWMAAEHLDRNESIKKDRRDEKRD